MCLLLLDLVMQVLLGLFMALRLILQLLHELSQLLHMRDSNSECAHHSERKAPTEAATEDGTALY